MSGPRSAPPELPNFRHVRWLGGGGFADVFLYEQLRPAREVAIKVLRTKELDAAAQRAFEAEGDLMARVSTHPYIVTIYGTDVAPDGRPYFVMEYYPRPHFGVQARQRRLGVAEVLQVGVRVASAVETAHRAGVLHRDIKPANVLVSQFGRPGLTDFGISGVRDQGVLAQAHGVTVAYAPAEVLLEQSPGDELGDVYSLGATLFVLLVGRSPFEVEGGSNSANDIAQRALNAPVPAIGRDDVPKSLELLLQQTLSRKPSHRPQSAAAFGRALQRVERELGHSPTEFEVEGEHLEITDEAPADDDATRAQRIQVVDHSQPSAPVPISRVPADGGAVPAAIAPPPRRRVAAPEPEAAGDTLHRAGTRRVAPVDDAQTEARASPRARRSQRMLVAGAVVLLVGVAAAIAVSAGGADPGTSSGSTSPPPSGERPVVLTAPPPPTEVVVTVNAAEGTAEVDWTANDSARTGDSYKIERGDTDEVLGVRYQEGPVVIEGVEGDELCVSVWAVRDGQQSAEPETECAVVR